MCGREDVSARKVKKCWICPSILKRKITEGAKIIHAPFPSLLYRYSFSLFFLSFLREIVSDIRNSSTAFSNAAHPVFFFANVLHRCVDFEYVQYSAASQRECIRDCISSTRTLNQQRASHEEYIVFRSRSISAEKSLFPFLIRKISILCIALLNNRAKTLRKRESSIILYFRYMYICKKKKIVIRKSRFSR